MSAPRLVKRLMPLAFAVIAASAAFAADPTMEVFTVARGKILPPYTDTTCLKDCHGVKGFSSGSAEGKRRDLFVDAKGYASSVHGKEGLSCTDCHSGADPNAHPRTGYPMADCRGCHAKVGSAWMKTSHAWAWEHGKPGAPFCSGCHTAHYVRPKADPESSVNNANIVATCSKCHSDLVDYVATGGFLARFKVSGHGKADPSLMHSAKACLSCHQGEGAHAEEILTGEKCPTCHKPKDAGADSQRFHLKTGPGSQGVSATVASVYNVLFWGGALVLAALAVFMGFSTIYRADQKRDRKD